MEDLPVWRGQLSEILKLAEKIISGRIGTNTCLMHKFNIRMCVAERTKYGIFKIEALPISLKYKIPNVHSPHFWVHKLLSPVPT